MKLIKKANGTLQTTFVMVIPILLSISLSRITNGQTVDLADRYPASGFVLSVHILGLITIGFVIPGFLINIWTVLTVDEA